MAFSLKTHGTSNGGSSPWTFTLPLSYSTQAGDCIVVVMPTGTGAVTVSGCGATWVINNSPLNSGAMKCVTAVGYNCTAGGTSITITGQSGTWGAVLGVFSGVLATANPIRNVASATGAGSGSLAYVAGDLLIGAFGDSNGETVSTSVWSNGGTDNLVGLNAGSPTFRTAYESYQISASGTTTTYTITTGGSQNTPCTMALALKPIPAAATGNMLAVMGL